jgi:hypothetical protein
LELVDENGDGMIVRYDQYADEASSKDASNSHSNNGRQVCIGSTGKGCFERDLDEDGFLDAHEEPANTDRDATCTAEGWPAAGVGPLLGDPELEGGCL